MLPFGQIEYVECTQHIVHFHLTSGEAVASLSQRVPFLRLATPLLADGRFIQTHRSYLAAEQVRQALLAWQNRAR